jgi:hypothetical protein
MILTLVPRCGSGELQDELWRAMELWRLALSRILSDWLFGMHSVGVCSHLGLLLAYLSSLS